MAGESCKCTADMVSDFINKMSQESGISDVTSLELAQFMSDSDALKTIRDEFHYPKCGTLPEVDLSLVDANADSIYLCGNSLGLLPKATERIMKEQFEKWAQMGVFGHRSGSLPWALADEEAIEGVGYLVGAAPCEVALCNGLTVNIHVLLQAFYKPTDTRHKILIESRAFPSDHYAVESQIRMHGRKVEESLLLLDPNDGEDVLKTEDILDFIRKHGHEIAIIWLPGIQYYTGQLFDIQKITQAGHEQGCLVGWDLAHAFANVPLHLHYWDVDFAAWCSYKYGCTGAGGLAGLFVHERFKHDKRDRMLGWWSHKLSTRFNMDNVLELDEGAAGYRISNPPIMLVVPVMGMLEVFQKVKLDDLRSRSCYLTGYLEFLVKHFFGKDSPNRTTKISCEVITPANFHERGCQLSLKFSHSIDVMYQELTKRGVAVDKRYPYVIRVTPVHLYNNYVDCRRFISALQEACLVAEQKS